MALILCSVAATAKYHRWGGLKSEITLSQFSRPQGQDEGGGRVGFPQRPPLLA